MQPPPKVRDHIIWIAAIFAFTLAAATGALYRLAVAYGFNTGLAFENVRHAHSHLMYFGWVTPALFLFISRRVERLTGRKATKTEQLSTIGALVFGFASFIPFLLFGYTAVEIGTLRFPPSVIIAGLNMLAWYGFVIGYLQQTRGLPRGRTIVLFDGALCFLVLASFGAWGISLAVPMGASNPSVSAALTHLFLGYFTEGWLTLALLGLATSFVKPSPSGAKVFMLITWMLMAGIAVSFLLGMPHASMTADSRTLARIASGFMAVGLLYFTFLIVKEAGRRWRIPSIFLFLKAIGFVVVVVTPTIWWADHVAERILYFHIHLLGWTTLGILAAAQLTTASRASHQVMVMNGAVTLVILSLLPMTLFWPTPLRGSWIAYAMAWAALGPVFVGLWMSVLQRPAALMPLD